MNEIQKLQNMLQLVDTHCHLDIERYFPDCEQTLRRARIAGVRDMVIAGVDRAGWSRIVELSENFDDVHAAPGLHPMYLHLHRDGDLEALASMAARCKLVAIGEVGLDFHIQNADRQAQQTLFEAQLDIAKRCTLPLLIHARKSHDQVLATLRRRHFQFGGIVHAFNGSYQQATHFIELGFKIGVCGTVTYDRSRKIRSVVASLPLDSLVLETDAPDIPPAKHWGELNQPEYLVEILDSLTQLRREERQTIANQTTQNARAILNLN